MKKLFPLFLSFFFFGEKTSAQSITLEPFSEGYNWLIGFEVAPGDDRLYVFQKDGFIKICNPDGSIEPTPFLDISAKVNNSFNNEQGLVGLAFHPDYQANGRFFVFYNETGTGTCTIARFERSATEPDVADPTTETTLLTWPHPLGNHVGGCLKFGADGYLYIASGDGGGAGDPNGHAQNLGSHFGKILRIDVDAGITYSPPAGNPFLNMTGALPEIYALGLRNPWRFAFHPLDDRIWIADVGQNEYEEINVRPSGDEGGGLNYGWACHEGSAIFDDAQCQNLPGTLTFPLHVYPHVMGGDCSISGGDFSMDATQGDLFGNYLYTDFCSGKIWMLEETIDWPNIYELGDFNDLDFTMIGRDNAGRLYAVGFFTNTIFRIETEACEPYASIGPPYSIGLFEGETTELETPFAEGLNYQWLLDGNEITGATSHQLTASESGEYTVVVTNSENGCSATALPVNITVESIAANIYGQAEACVASSHYYETDFFAGALYEWTVSGGTLLDGQGSPEIFVLWDDVDFGHLTLQLTLPDGSILSGEQWVEIFENDLSLDADFTEAVCIGSNEGFIDLTVNGTGTSFEFFWNTNETTEDIFNLPAGAYKVTVTSDLGCQIGDGFLIFEVDEPTLDWDVTPQVCDTPGAISGIGNSAACGDFPLPELMDISTGAYNVIATDCFGCTYPALIEVPQVFNSFTFDATVSFPTPGNSDGSIELTPMGGNEPYSYSWGDGSSENPRTDLPPGEYPVTVTDSDGCAVTSIFLLEDIVDHAESVFLEKNTRLFPNPTGGLFTLEMDLPQAEKMTVRLLDSAGKFLQLLFSEKNMGAGNQGLNFDLSDWPSGVYFLEIKIGEVLFAKQVIKEG